VARRHRASAAVRSWAGAPACRAAARPTGSPRGSGRLQPRPLRARCSCCGPLPAACHFFQAPSGPLPRPRCRSPLEPRAERLGPRAIRPCPQARRRLADRSVTAHAAQFGFVHTGFALIPAPRPSRVECTGAQRISWHLRNFMSLVRPHFVARRPARCLPPLHVIRGQICFASLRFSVHVILPQLTCRLTSRRLGGELSPQAHPPVHSPRARVSDGIGAASPTLCTLPDGGMRSRSERATGVDAEGKELVRRRTNVRERAGRARQQARFTGPLGNSLSIVERRRVPTKLPPACDGAPGRRQAGVQRPPDPSSKRLSSLTS
jgi:hypothetical protein